MGGIFREDIVLDDLHDARNLQLKREAIDVLLLEANYILKGGTIDDLHDAKKPPAKAGGN